MRIQPRNRSSSLKRPRWGWFPANIETYSCDSPSPKFFWLSGSKLCIPVHFAHCLFYRATQMQRIDIGWYMPGSGVWSVCLSQGNKALFYQCSWTYHQKINRKLRWTLWGVQGEAMLSRKYFLMIEINKPRLFRDEDLSSWARTC